MKHLLTSVAVVAALAFSAPVWAQPASPSGGNSMGMPGPNPGGPGLTPYSSGPRTTAAPPPSAPAPAMAPSAMPPSSMSDTSSAMPPSHRHARHAAHGKPLHHPSHFPNLQGNVANQLNQAELALAPIRQLLSSRRPRRVPTCRHRRRARRLLRGGCPQEEERRRADLQAS